MSATLSNRLPGLNFDLGEAADMLRGSVETFAADEIAPRAAAIDRDNDFPEDLWRKMGDLGVLRHHGGGGVRRRWHGLPGARRGDGGDQPGQRLRGPQLRRAQQPLREPDPQERHRGAERRRYLPKLISGEHVGALAMSESGSGSDVVSMRLRADKRGDRYVLNGTKMWITNGPNADVLVVYAKTDPAAGPRAASPPS